MYYLKKDYKILGYKPSNVGLKKYSAILENIKTKKQVKIHFGHKNYDSYQDKTGLNIYKTHNDKQRRELYRKRAIGKVKNDYYSPSWFSYYILW